MWSNELDTQRTVVTEREPTLEELTDLLFAWKAVRHVKSNAIVLAKNLMVVGVGAGQMSRVYSVQIAVERAGDRSRGSVHGLRRLFPLPGWRGDGGQGGCHGDHPAGRLEAR